MKGDASTLVWAALFWCAAVTLVSAEGAELCASAQSTAEMRGCLDKEYEKADAELNAVWNKVMAQVSKADHMPAEDAKAWKEELLIAQRAWVDFKEHDCDAAGFEWYGGTGAPGAILSCLLAHTTARTADLKARYLDR